MKKWQPIIVGAVFSAFWVIPAIAESYGCADGTSSCHTNTGSTGGASGGSSSGSNGSPGSGSATNSNSGQRVIIGTLGPVAANYGTWRAEYIGTKTSNGKYASPSIKIYSNTKNSLRCTGKIVLEDATGYMLTPAITTKIVPAYASGTLVSASNGVASWAPSFSVQCENINDYPPAGSNSSSGTSSGSTGGSAGGSTTVSTNGNGNAASSPIPGPTFQVGQGLTQPVIEVVASNTNTGANGGYNGNTSANSAGSSAPNCLYSDGCYFGFFGKISSDSNAISGLVKQIRFSIEQISNTTDLPSGDIRIEVWGMLNSKNGYLLGQKSLTPLEPGYYRANSIDADMTQLPAGSYRIMLVARSAIGSDAVQMDGSVNSYGPSGVSNGLKITLADQLGAVPDASSSGSAIVPPTAGTGTQSGATAQSNNAPPAGNNASTSTPPANGNSGNTAPSASNNSATAPVTAAGGDGGGGGGCSVGSGNPFDPSLWLLAIGAAAAIASRKRPIGR